MTLAARLLELRNRKKKSLQEVADAVGVSKAHIWDLEKGRATNPSVRLVIELADYFTVSIGYLVGEDLSNVDDPLARTLRKVSKLPTKELPFLDAIIQAIIEGKHRS